MVVDTAILVNVKQVEGFLDLLPLLLGQLGTGMAALGALLEGRVGKGRHFVVLRAVVLLTASARAVSARTVQLRSLLVGS